MPRARKRKQCACCAEPCASTRRARRTKRRRGVKDREDNAMEGTVTSQEDHPPNQETLTSLQTTAKVGCSTQTPALPTEPESNNTKAMLSQDNNPLCPACSSSLKPAVGPRGSTSSLLQCSQCSTTLLCEECLYPCPDGTCTNKSCQVVSLLLKCDNVANASSKVCGCPLFRACPKCNSLMMHEKGCKYVSCVQCRHTYCFICLKTSQECRKDKTKYWSLICSAPRAPRQRFQT